MSLRNHRFREVLKVLQKHGFKIDRQSGSHLQLVHQDGRYVTLPRQDPIKQGTQINSDSGKDFKRAIFKTSLVNDYRISLTICAIT